MKALLQIHLRTAGVALASHNFNLCQNWCRSLQAVLSSPKDKSRFNKKFQKFLVFLSHVSWRFGVYFMVRFSSIENKRFSMQRGKINP